MNITTRHSRAFIGNDIEVAIAADANEIIRTVTVVLDGFTLAEFEAQEGTQGYDRIFPQAGDAGPGEDHSLVVTVTEQDGRLHSSTTQWTDMN